MIAWERGDPRRSPGNPNSLGSIASTAIPAKLLRLFLMLGLSSSLTSALGPDASVGCRFWFAKQPIEVVAHHRFFLTTMLKEELAWLAERPPEITGSSLEESRVALAEAPLRLSNRTASMTHSNLPMH